MTFAGGMERSSNKRSKWTIVLNTMGHHTRTITRGKVFKGLNYKKRQQRLYIVTTTNRCIIERVLQQYSMLIWEK